ncbi:MAG: DUF3291 domain-containing protein [Pseudomonadota bacterium]
MQKMHIAELNIGKLRHAPDDPRMAEFMSNLARINALAERSPGFVWRLQGDGDGAIDIFHPDHPDTNVNLSVWETPEDLEAYVFKTVHVQFYRRKHDWFQMPRTIDFVMWPVPAGHIPTVIEAWDRLEHLRAHGSSDHAYGWEALPHLKDWMEKRCA